MKVVKRDSTIEEFNSKKIETAILKAFKACKYKLNDGEKEEIAEFCESFKGRDNYIPVEVIQDEVEKFLTGDLEWFDVGKAYILYREKHKQARLIKERLDYIHKYANSNESATNLSNTDDNANSNQKNVASLESEVYKDLNRIVQRMEMKHLLTEIGSPYRDQYEKDLNHHIMYTHDEASSPVQKPYCSAYTLYPLLLDGTDSVDGTKNHAPKHLSSFCGQFQNLVFLLSAQKKGAGAYGEFFNFFSYFCEKEWGKDYWLKADTVVTNEHWLEDMTIGQIIDQYFQSVTHYINQPAQNRGYQCVTEDTELWTPSGFKSLKELKVGDECYVFNKKTKKYEVEKIKKLNVYDFDGELLRFSSRDYQQTVTPNHRVLNYKTNSDELRLTDAKDLFNKTAIRVPTTGILDNPDYPITDAEIKIIASLYTDGSFDYAEGHGDPRTRFYMSPNRKGLEILKEALTECGVEYNEKIKVSKISNTEIATIIPTKETIRKYSQFIGYNKTILAEALFKFSKRQLDIFFDTWANIDGQLRNKNTNRYMLQCDNDYIADQLQRLAQQAGYNNKIRLCYRRANGVFKESYTRYVVLYGRDKRTITKYEKIPYKGKVWCPTTDAGIVVFREGNLMPYITGNSPFTNFNIFDSNYWHAMFDNFTFPDGSKPNWNAVNWLQKKYMQWLNLERTKTLLTFPVVTVCLLTDGKDVVDKEYKDFVTLQWSLGDSFFVYLSQNVDSISSCCRLRNEITENTFSSTTGLTGVQTGSCNVITLNLNRIIQDWWNSPNSFEDDTTITTLKRISETKMMVDAIRIGNKIKSIKRLQKYLENILDRVYDYQRAYKTGLYKLDKQGMFPQTKAGYISLDKLYCTIGVNGLNEAARFLGMEVSNNEAYMDFASWILKVTKDYNKENSSRKFMFNLELVPAESLGVKNYNWDKEDGYWVPDDENLYNSYIYDAHDDTSILDKIAMQGGKISKSIDGGQASHLNLQENLSMTQYEKLLEYAVQQGNNYLTFNVPQTQCDKCGYIAKHPFDECPECGSDKVTQWTRIIGYLRPMKAWSEARQIEGKNRMFAKKESII